MMVGQSTVGERWLVSRVPHTTARIRLFCFGYAGAGAYAFATWQQQLPGFLHVHAVQLPGRENRMAEPLLCDPDAIVAQVAPVIARYHDLPFALFGHSVGAVTAFEVTRWLRRHDRCLPSVLFVSGRRAADRPMRGGPLHHLPDGEFLDAVGRFGGTPPGVLDDPDLAELFLPVLRADITAAEIYECRPEPPLECPIVALHGVADATVDADDVAAWQRHTVAGFRQHTFPGDHFFIRQDEAAVLKAVVDELT
jgi:medium-chain acyl-[acyl-carrier-protein] hydrolase